MVFVKAVGKLRVLANRFRHLRQAQTWRAHLVERARINAELEALVANPGSLPRRRELDPGEMERWRAREQENAAALDRLWASAQVRVARSDPSSDEGD